MPSSAYAAPPVRNHPSPNHGDRRGRTIDMIVLHYTDMPDAAASLDLLTDPAREVSCHYLIDLDGTIYRLVDDNRRAWHAGVSAWRQESDINAVSLGIELQNGGERFGQNGRPDPFPAEQIRSLTVLARHLMARYGIPAERILGHSDVAPGRKRDPGAGFPWAELASLGVGVWPDGMDSVLALEPATRVPLRQGTSGTRTMSMQQQLSEIGYVVRADGMFGPRTAAVVEAFQLHFRPERVDRIADAETLFRLGAVHNMICTARA